MKKKQCTVCYLTKPVSEFYTKNRSKVRKDGTVHKWTGLYSSCKECVDGKNKEFRHKYDEYYKQYRKMNKERIQQTSKEHYINSNIEWVNLIETEKELKCSNCGYCKTWAALDFHHEDPREKENSIHRIMKSGKPNEARWKEMKKELAKCIVLCSNCHRETHMKYNWLELKAEKVVKEYKK